MRELLFKKPGYLRTPPFFPSMYFIATIHEWKLLLTNNSYKDIIIDSLQTLVSKKRIELFVFVLMRGFPTYKHPNLKSVCGNLDREDTYTNSKPDFLLYEVRLCVGVTWVVYKDLCSALCKPRRDKIHNLIFELNKVIN